MEHTLDWKSLVTDPQRLSSVAANPSFSRLRCFHLCRPEDVTSYYTDGIRLVARDELCQKFREIFSDLPSAVVDAAITKFPGYDTPQQVHVGVDCRLLLQYCGHYCIYGSEYLTALCTHLNTSNGKDWRQRLKRIGRPTVIVLEIPFDELPSADADKLINDLQRVANGDMDMDNVLVPGMLLECGISFGHPLPPEWIVNHHHPESVFDPLIHEQYTCPS